MYLFLNNKTGHPQVETVLSCKLVSGIQKSNVKSNRASQAKRKSIHP